MQSEYVLEMKHITKHYGGNVVLSDVSLSVKRGEIHALLGENGAGKSTLMNTLSVCRSFTAPAALRARCCWTGKR